MKSEKNDKKTPSRHSLLTETALAAAFAALILLATAYLPRIPVGNGGYIHAGDAVLFAAAALLSPFGAAAAGAAGETLADLLSGAAVWAPATFIIKMLMALIFCFGAGFARKNADRRSEVRLLTLRAVAAAVAAGIVGAAGYFFYEGFLYSFPAALASLPLNLIQAAGSAALYAVLAVPLQKARRFLPC